MRYAGIDLYPQRGTVIVQDSKEVHIYEYPRLNEADAQLLKRGCPVIRCTLLIPSEDIYLALKYLDLTNAEEVLYIDSFGKKNARYYKRVLLQLGEEKHYENLVVAPATFTALDPRLYDTSGVIY